MVNKERRIVCKVADQEISVLAFEEQEPREAVDPVLLVPTSAGQEGVSLRAVASLAYERGYSASELVEGIIVRSYELAQGYGQRPEAPLQFEDVLSVGRNGMASNDDGDWVVANASCKQVEAMSALAAYGVHIEDVETNPVYQMIYRMASADAAQTASVSIEHMLGQSQRFEEKVQEVAD